MRIGCLQFAPKVGDVSNNLSRADAVLTKADPMELDNLDLLVLPEMAFSGYNFKSLQEIMPHLEPSGSGISSLWARTTALKYDCTVAVGYPEKVDASRRRPSAPEYYNSLIVVNGDGETVANYRKSFLYYTDATWALEGDGFYAGEVEDFGQVAMGICMDINPYKFEAPWHAFEFAFHILEVQANLVILSMAWLTLEDRSTFTPFPREPDMETITYWCQRLEPVIRAESEEEIIVVFCNRCGIEDDVVYAGTSAVIGIKHGEVSVYGLLGRGVKELLIVNTDLPPFAKLVNRPDGVTEPESAAPSSLPEDQAEDQPAQVSTNAPAPVSPGFQESDLPTSARTHPEPEPRTEAVHDLSDLSPAEEPSPPVETTAPPAVDAAPSAAEPEECSECDEEEECYDGCEGDCGGCDEHLSDGVRDYLDSPICPSPTPIDVRPRFQLPIGPQTVPPMPTKTPPVGMQPGNFFTSRDLGTPPMTPFDDTPVSPSQYYWNHQPTEPIAARTYTPEEPVWAPYEGSTKIDFKRTPSRGPPPKPPTRPASRTAEVKPSDIKSPEEITWGPVSHKPRSRNTSKARDMEPVSPTTTTTADRQPRSRSNQRRLRDRSESNQRHPRERTARSQSTSPGRNHRAVSASRDHSRRHLARKLLGIENGGSIPIAASPSVFQTTFAQASTRPREATKPVREQSAPPVSYSRTRSKSVSNTIPLFQYQAPPIPPLPRMATFPTNKPSSSSSSSSSRGRSRRREREPSLPRQTASKSVPDLPAGANSVHPEIQSLVITEAEAFRGRTVPVRQESRERRKAPKRRHSISRERRNNSFTPVDIMSPISI